MKLIAETISNDQITLYSAQSVYYIIISAIPFIMLFLILAGNFITIDEESMLLFLADFVPESVYSFFAFVIDEVFSNTASYSVSFSTIALLWSASRSFNALSSGLGSVYHVKEKRGFVTSNLFALLYTVVFFAVIILSLIIMVFGNVIAGYITVFFPPLAEMLNSILSARSVVAIVVLTFFFAVLYKFVPAHRVKFGKQLPGALFAASGWIIFSLFFSIYIDNFSNRSYIYGSLTALIVLMLWIYCCIIILLIGGEINYYLSQNNA